MHSGLGVSGDGFDVLEGVEVGEGILESVVVVKPDNLEGVVGVWVELSHFP